MDGFTPYSDLPQFYIDVTISVEDHRFESHFGIDLIALVRAALKDIKEMSFVQGGSTIIQQLAKNMLFTQEKRLERKRRRCLRHWNWNPNIAKRKFSSYMPIRSILEADTMVFIRLLWAILEKNHQS